MTNFVLTKNLSDDFILDKSNKKINIKGLISGLNFDNNIIALNTTDGVSFKVDLSTLSNDKFLSNVELNNGVLTLHLNDNTHYDVDLTPLNSFNGGNTPTIKIAGNGKNEPLTASIVLNEDKDNLLTVTDTGLKASLNLIDTFGNVINLK